MQRYFLFVLFCLAVYSSTAQSLRVEIRHLPASHPAAAPVYLAGSFNQWNPKDEAYRFRMDSSGQYSLIITLPAGAYDFKLTRGSWEQVECRINGGSIANRVMETGRDSLLLLDIEAWQDQVAQPQSLSTASKNVRIIDTAFYIPSLQRKRTIRIYLPPGYAQSKKRYPVLYMQDGQNLFNDKTSYAGEWGIDELLDSAQFRECIVVGVDHGGMTRMNEYSPFDFSLYENPGKILKGEGRQYAAFLATRLKPYIDRQYRTLPSAKNNFVGGSSMGGLISLYTAMMYPRVFGGAAVLSPSVWICKDSLISYIRQRGNRLRSRFFFYAGKKESESMVPDMLLVFQQLLKSSKARMTTLIRDDGKHNENTWRREMPSVMEWLLAL